MKKQIVIAVMIGLVSLTASPILASDPLSTDHMTPVEVRNAIDRVGQEFSNVTSINVPRYLESLKKLRGFLDELQKEVDAGAMNPVEVIKLENRLKAEMESKVPAIAQQLAVKTAELIQEIRSFARINNNEALRLKKLFDDAFAQE